MKRPAGLIALLMAFAVQGCIASTVVLHVAPDGHGRAVITSRLFEPAMHAFDSMFSESPSHAKAQDLLPPPSPADLAEQFGAAVTLASTKLDLLQDGALRTTVVEFEDVTRLRIAFPPIFAMPGERDRFGMGGVSDRPVISFAIKPHDNGDRLLLVRLPEERIDPGPDPEVTVFKTDSPEEQLFKLAIKGMALRFFVELDEVQLLRTNAPASKGGRATILDLDLDKVINNLDENKVRRAMTPGSMQEILWQLGDMPGAVVPRDHEVFLEFEGPQAAAARAGRRAGGAGAARHRDLPGADEDRERRDRDRAGRRHHEQPGLRQPAVLHARRPERALHVGPRGGTQTDIYRYDILPRQVVAGDEHAGERVLADGDAGGKPLRHPGGARWEQHAAALAVHGRRPRSAARAGERQAGRLSRVGRRSHARACSCSASRRRCSSPTRAPARPSSSRPTSAGPFSGFPARAGERGRGDDQLRAARAFRDRP